MRSPDILDGERMTQSATVRVRQLLESHSSRPFLRWRRAVALSAAAALAVFSALVGSSSFLLYLAGAAEVESSAGDLLADAEFVLDRTVAELTDVRQSRYVGCDAATRKRLEESVYRSLYVREIGIITPDARVVCTNFGPTEIDLRKVYGSSLPAAGVFLALRTTLVMRERSVIVNVLSTDRNGANGLIAPERFAAVARTFPFPEHGGIRLDLADGTEIVSAGRVSADGDGSLVVSRASSRYPIRVTATVERAALLARSTRLWPLHALIAAALAGILFVTLVKAFPDAGPLADEIQRAIDAGEFQLLYQPVVSLKHRRIVGAEALIRWNHPRLGLMSPDTFLPFVSRAGLDQRLTLFVLRTVGQNMKSNVARFGARYVSVNLPATVLNDDTMVQEVDRLFVGSPFRRSQLVLEVTEREMLDARSREVVKTLRGRGCHVGLDDFGMGHSTLKFLESHPFNFIKIDRSFVSGIGVSDVSAQITRILIELAQRLNLNVIAEGVETEEQAAFVADAGCQFAQGYYFSRPTALQDFLSMLDREDLVDGPPPAPAA
jgi:sensor c-di-GMP phosphodiesterase-like protein